MNAPQKDIIFLVADKDIEQTIHGLLKNPERLKIKSITYDIFSHPHRDPGCWNESDTFLRNYTKQYRYAMVLFDHYGSGQDSKPVGDLQSGLENRLFSNGWDERARVIILHPELEIWVWSDSSRVDECLGWTNRTPDLRSWLREHRLLSKDAIKPDDPKLALEKALREVRKPRSASLYRQLAETVSFNRCVDPGFRLLITTFQKWFSPD